MRVLPDVVDTHHRTPAYVKGRTGRVHAPSGSFHDPEDRAYGGSGLPKRDLYLIEFDMQSLWGPRYGGGEEDKLLIDIYEQWLEPAGNPAGRQD
ncbi:MAG: nitrile hydratase subunit beta [bacterium]|nr:nitrile hydratase subunit beta [bacterium]MDE0235451.1 nitrile hydratase subunit beta [bacterium]